jgi:uncharacterized protein (DUF1015 family)
MLRLLIAVQVGAAEHFTLSRRALELLQHRIQRRDLRVRAETPLLRPFRGLRPAPGRAPDVIAPPYDVITSEEARAQSAGKPWSFLHISRAEIDFPAGTDPYSQHVYAAGAASLARMIKEGVLVRDATPCYYAYRMTAGEHTRLGIVGVGSLAHYATHRIRRHELTTPEKEDDRVRQIDALNAQTGPVMSAYPDAPAVDSILAEATRDAPDADVIDTDDVRHSLWVIREPRAIERLSHAFNAMRCFYIADGHHRSAAAARVARARRKQGSAAEGSHDYFLNVIFPVRDMRILGYNRLLTDLGGLTPGAFVERVRERFTVETTRELCRPSAPREFSLYTGGVSYRLRLRPVLHPNGDALSRLDVRILSDFLLEPVLGIKDNGRDKRVAYVGGSRGMDELVRRVRSGEMAAAVALYPTQMSDVMAVADAGGIMPPKSTWFAPKLVDGLISHVLD